MILSNMIDIDKNIIQVNNHENIKLFDQDIINVTLKTY